MVSVIYDIFSYLYIYIFSHDLVKTHSFFLQRGNTIIVFNKEYYAIFMNCGIWLHTDQKTCHFLKHFTNVNI